MVSEEIRGMIPDFARGLLSSEDAAKVERALSDHPELIEEYKTAKRYYLVLDQLPKVNAPASFIDRVNKRIDRESPGKALARLLLKPFAIKLPLELAAVTACLLAVVLIIKPFSYLQKDMTTTMAPSLAEKEYTIANQPVQVQQPMLEQKKFKAALPSEKQRIDAVVMENALEEKTAGISQKHAAAGQVQKPKAKDAPAKASEQFALKQQSKLAASSLGAGVSTESVRRTTTTGTVVQAADLSPEQPSFDKISRSSRTNEPAANAATPAELSMQSAPSTKIPEKLLDIGTIEIAYGASMSKEKATSVKDAEAASAPASTDVLAKSEFEKDVNITIKKEKKATMRAAVPAKTSQETHIALESILLQYDSLLVVSTQRGKFAYTLTVTPSHLTALKHELERSFRLTTHTRDFDPQQTERIKVTFVVKQ